MPLSLDARARSVNGSRGSVGEGTRIELWEPPPHAQEETRESMRTRCWDMNYVEPRGMVTRTFFLTPQPPDPPSGRGGAILCVSLRCSGIPVPVGEGL